MRQLRRSPPSFAARATARTPLRRAARGPRIAVLAARFNAVIVDRLLDACLTTLRSRGIGDEQVQVVRVPGAFELPVAARAAIRHGVDLVIALGCVIRGDTPHFDYVAGQCARGLMDAGAEVPVIFGVLTCETYAQAEARAGGRRGDAPGNKGGEAAEAGLDMLGVLAGIAAGQPRIDLAAAAPHAAAAAARKRRTVRAGSVRPRVRKGRR